MSVETRGDEIELDRDQKREISLLVNLSQQMGRNTNANDLIDKMLQRRRREIEEQKRRTEERNRKSRGKAAAIEVHGKDRIEGWAESYLQRYNSDYNQADIFDYALECVEMLGSMHCNAYRPEAPNPDKAPNSAKIFGESQGSLGFGKPALANGNTVLDNTNVKAVIIPMCGSIHTGAYDFNEPQKEMMQIVLESISGDGVLEQFPETDGYEHIICYPTPELINAKAKQDCVELF